MTTLNPASAVRQALCECTSRRSSDIAAAAIQAAANTLLRRPAIGDQSEDAVLVRLLHYQFLALVKGLSLAPLPAASRKALAEAEDKSMDSYAQCIAFSSKIVLESACAGNAENDIKGAVVATLLALADQVVPHDSLPSPIVRSNNLYNEGRLVTCNRIRAELLAIAAELADR